MFFESRKVREKFDQSILCAYELQIDPEREMDREPVEEDRGMRWEEGDKSEMGI